GHLDSKTCHGLLEFLSVLAALDGIYLNADYLYIVFVKNACCCQLRTQVQSGLSAQVREQRVWTLLFNNLCQTVYIQRLDIGNISSFRICHDSSRVGVYQHNLIAELSKSFTCLSSRIVELTCLSDNDWTGAN